MEAESLTHADALTALTWLLQAAVDGAAIPSAPTGSGSGSGGGLSLPPLDDRGGASVIEAARIDYERMKLAVAGASAASPPRPGAPTLAEKLADALSATMFAKVKRCTRSPTVAAPRSHLSPPTPPPILHPPPSPTPCTPQFPRDELGCVPFKLLARHLCTRVTCQAAWRRAAAYDSEGDGFLREHDLENMVFDAIPALPDLSTLQDNFYPFYVFTAVRKVCFFLDPHRTGRVSLEDLVASKVLQEWMALYPPAHEDAGGPLPLPGAELPAWVDGTTTRPPPPPAALTPETWLLPAAAPVLRPPTPETYRHTLAFLRSCHSGTPVVPASNWFSAANAVRVYTMYLELDTDANGLLSLQEMARVQNGTLTPAFLARVFQEARTYGGELDYKAFLEFLLAVENRSTTASMRYVFNTLDMRRLGALRLLEIRHFFGDVAHSLAAAGHDTVDIANICDEIFDMVAPATPGTITLEDLRRCKQGHTVLHMLTDVAGFWAYDNREALLAQQQASGEGGGSGGEGSAGGGGAGPGAAGGSGGSGVSAVDVSHLAADEH